jgi:ABC-type sugar transport system ATPase subunit
MLSLSRIEKTFGATRAPKSVTLEAAGGTVLGLAGENGAGKSTLIKIVSGAVVPDRGASRSTANKLLRATLTKP